MRLKRTSDAAVEPLSTAEAKTHLKIDGSDQDTYIASIIKAARQHAEEYTFRSFITQTWKMYLNGWPDVIRLPRGVVQSVTSVEYIDSAGSTQTVGSSLYTTSLGGEIGLIRAVDSWPETNSDYEENVIVTFVAGYGDASTDLPEGLIQGIRILVADFDSFRQSYTKQINKVLPDGRPYYSLFLDQYKIYY